MKSPIAKLTREGEFNPRVIIALLVMLAAVAYYPALDNGFIWDDPEYIINNPTLRTAEGLKQIWFEPGATPQYYPLVFSAFWLEFQGWQLDAYYYHLINVLLHALSAILLWALLRKLGIPGAWLAAAIFAIHPVHVESVAWITERKNVQSGVLYLGAFVAYLRFAVGAGRTAASADGNGESKASSLNFYFLALGLFVAALLSKTVVCTLPAAIVLVLWWKKGRIGLRDLVPLIPFFIFGVGLAMVTVAMEKFHVGALGDEWSLTFAEKIMLAGRIIWFYACKLVLPADLMFIYPRWTIDGSVWWQSLFSAGVIVSVVALFVYRKTIGRGPLVAVLFFAGTLTPALGFFNVYPMRFSFVADHFQYLASLGLIVLAAAVIARLINTARREMRWASRALCWGMVIVLGALTWDQCSIYKDQETLWRATIASNPRAWIAHNNLGEILVAQGKIDEAMVHCEAALDLKPDLPEALGNLANCLFRKGKFDEAVSNYDKLLDLDPENAKAFSNRGAALENLGKLDDAVESFKEALRITPAFANAHFNLGNVLVKLGRTKEAITHYSEAGRLNPGFTDALYKLGLLYEQSADESRAIDAFRRTVQQRPSWVEATNKLAWLLATKRDATPTDRAEAIRLAEANTRQIATPHPVLLDTLAAAYARSGRFGDASATAQKAIDAARGAKQDAQAAQIETRLKLYRENRPFLR